MNQTIERKAEVFFSVENNGGNTGKVLEVSRDFLRKSTCIYVGAATINLWLQRLFNMPIPKVLKSISFSASLITAEKDPLT